jgi:pimeloyl-ACP methyl ester carboxylesterase
MPLKLFHGELDVNAPIALVRSMVAKLPGAHLVTYEDEAHFSTLCNHFDEITLAVDNQ